MRNPSEIIAEIDRLGRPYRVFFPAEANQASVEAQEQWDMANPYGKERSQMLHNELDAARLEIAEALANTKALEKASKSGGGSKSIDAALAGKPTRHMTFIKKWWVVDPPSWVCVLHGDVGVGKTVAATWAFIEAGKKGMSTEVRRCAEIVKLSQFDGAPELARLKRVGLLVLDDFGAESLTDYGTALLTELLDARYEERRLTVITSNLKKDPLEQRFGPRLWDRMRDGGMRLEVLGESLRHPQKAQESLPLITSPR